jgi:hypothetical protein
VFQIIRRILPFLSLSFAPGRAALWWESCSLSVCLSPLLIPLARRKICILLVLLAPFLSHSLASPPPSKFLLDAFSFSTPSLFCLLFLFLRLCVTLSGDTTTDYPMCSTLSVDNTTDCLVCSSLSALLSIALLLPTMLCTFLYSV